MSLTTILSFDSATPQEAYDLTLAFQRTSGLTPGMVLPPQITQQPTVAVSGSALAWTSPRLTFEHAEALLDEFRRLQGWDARVPGKWRDES